MSNFFETRLTTSEIVKLKRRLQSKGKRDEKCFIWTGQQRNGYGVLQFRFRGKKINLPIHRLTYYIYNECVQIPPHVHISHICHNKLCFEIDHLSFEPQRINNNRQICKNDGECTGHHGYVNCIL